MQVVDNASPGHMGLGDPGEWATVWSATPAAPNSYPQRASYGRPRTAVPADGAEAGDLGELLCAVQARLCSTVSEGGAFPQDVRRAPSIHTVQSGVLECVRALDQVQAILARDQARRRELEQEVADTQLALAQALAQLAGTQAGERHARHLARHDSLTLLPNRAYFLERLDAEAASLAARRQSLAVLFLDLDDFKPINDRYGHDMGDELLRIVGVRLARSVRADDMVCRLGGDEFGCLLMDIEGPAQLVQLARKLMDAIAAPLQIGKCRLVVRPSIGIALGPAHGTTSADLLRHADAAMYRAKRHQTGFAFFG
jgi:diguanylate cyclase (GGDEF)-like protein